MCIKAVNHWVWIIAMTILIFTLLIIYDSIFTHVKANSYRVCSFKKEKVNKGLILVENAPYDIGEKVCSKYNAIPGKIDEISMSLAARLLLKCQGPRSKSILSVDSEDPTKCQYMYVGLKSSDAALFVDECQKIHSFFCSINKTEQEIAEPETDGVDTVREESDIREEGGQVDNYPVSNDNSQTDGVDNVYEDSDVQGEQKTDNNFPSLDGNSDTDQVINEGAEHTCHESVEQISNVLIENEGFNGIVSNSSCGNEPENLDSSDLLSKDQDQHERAVFDVACLQNENQVYPENKEQVENHLHSTEDQSASNVDNQNEESGDINELNERQNQKEIGDVENECKNTITPEVVGEVSSNDSVNDTCNNIDYVSDFREDEFKVENSRSEPQHQTNYLDIVSGHQEQENNVRLGLSSKYPFNSNASRDRQIERDLERIIDQSRRKIGQSHYKPSRKMKRNGRRNYSYASGANIYQSRSNFHESWPYINPNHFSLKSIETDADEFHHSEEGQEASQGNLFEGSYGILFNGEN